MSQGRIGVEHSLRGVKVFHSVADPVRHLRLGFDDLVLQIACPWHTLRLDFPLAA